MPRTRSACGRGSGSGFTQGRLRSVNRRLSSLSLEGQRMAAQSFSLEARRPTFVLAGVHICLVLLRGGDQHSDHVPFRNGAQISAYSAPQPIHDHPSLPNRARHAAPATVRVRWKNGRGTRLTHGLKRSGGYRAPVRHRDSHGMRVAVSQITRGSRWLRKHVHTPIASSVGAPTPGCFAPSRLRLGRCVRISVPDSLETGCTFPQLTHSLNGFWTLALLPIYNEDGRKGFTSGP